MDSGDAIVTLNTLMRKRNPSESESESMEALPEAQTDEGKLRIARYQQIMQRLEQESAISSFAFSDFGLGGTNAEGPVAGIEYQLLNPLTVGAKGYFTNYINRPTNTSNGTLSRVQIDAMLKF